jgi:hypothetical protein
MHSKSSQITSSDHWSIIWTVIRTARAKARGWELAESSRATAPGLDLRRRCGPFLVCLRATCSSALDANGRAGASRADATSRKEAALFAVASCAANLGTYLYDYTPPRKHSAVPTTGTMLAAAGSTRLCQASNHCTRLLFDKRYHLG